MPSSIIKFNSSVNTFFGISCFVASYLLFNIESHAINWIAEDLNFHGQTGWSGIRLGSLPFIFCCCLFISFSYFFSIRSIFGIGFFIFKNWKKIFIIIYGVYISQRLFIARGFHCLSCYHMKRMHYRMVFIFPQSSYIVTITWQRLAGPSFEIETPDLPDFLPALYFTGGKKHRNHSDFNFLVLLMTFFSETL